MKKIPLNHALAVAVKAARAAGKVMRDNWHKPKRVKLDDIHDIKLELDVRCQTLIEKNSARRVSRNPVARRGGRFRRRDRPNTAGWWTRLTAR